ncbi:hypothetical protein I350_07923 [Cryptococcus amylolentus CBS 6273]|uniref:Gti1/Pac2 family protein n=1 Tax=Cryptococcus amylolentus CBS 6273 TaxID=1296118 RepID=A0A1E3J7W0_9TREE|nr:hypothetical protein I350_07923 [Cryptococcus amylolentus CBS 6273]
MPSPPMSSPPSPPCNLDPPFRGYIESTFDALLVFEAARRGMIPRVTRRLIERERGMVQSGAVFVFDEHESGIKRWTDGLVWSPSRILGNFLVYRETDKRSSSKASNSPTQTSPPSNSNTLVRPTSSSATPHKFEAQAVLPHINTSIAEANGEPSPLGQGALARPRSSSEGGGNMDRQKERQLVGSLTNSYKFKEGGLVKKTMSVSVNGFAQHVVSYYAIDDVINGKLRTPSSIPELASLEISAEYLQKQNFRFPPQVEVGQDGIPRYRGEPEEPTSPHTPAINYSFPAYQQQPPAAGADYYDPVNAYLPQHQQLHRMSSPRSRPINVPMLVPLPSPAHSVQGSSYMGPSSAGSGTFYSESPVNGMGYAPPLVRQNSGSSVTSTGSAIRPGSGASRRYTPYGPGNRNSSGSSVGYQVHARRTSDSSQNSPYSPDASYDIKPTPSPYYHTPNTAPSTFSSFYPPPEGHHMEQMASPTYSGYAPWQIHASQQGGQGQTSRLIPTRQEYAAPPPLGPPPPGHGHHLNPPSSSGSGGSGSSDAPPALPPLHHHPHHAPPHHHPHGSSGGGQELQREWSHQSQGNVPHAPGWEGMGVGAGTPSPEYGVPIHQQHEEWRQGAGTMA